MPSKINPNAALKNYLLASLPAVEFARFKPFLEPVSFKIGDVIYESNDKMEYAYFPTTLIVSLLYIMENGATAEIGIVGNQGILGISMFLGGDTTTKNRAIIQSAGAGFRLKVKDLQAEFARHGVFHDLLLRYSQALLVQVSMTAVCNRLHTVEDHLSRWLLLSHDRLDSDKLVMTHDLISNMLGVRREGVTLAAQKLAEKNLIKNSRGTITITNRRGLEENSCECYDVISDEYNRLLGRGISRTFT